MVVVVCFAWHRFDLNGGGSIHAEVAVQFEWWSCDSGNNVVVVVEV